MILFSSQQQHSFEQRGLHSASRHRGWGWSRTHHFPRAHSLHSLSLRDWRHCRIRCAQNKLFHYPCYELILFSNQRFNQGFLSIFSIYVERLLLRVNLRELSSWRVWKKVLIWFKLAESTVWTIWYCRSRHEHWTASYFQSQSSVSWVLRSRG